MRCPRAGRCPPPIGASHWSDRRGRSPALLSIASACRAPRMPGARRSPRGTLLRSPLGCRQQQSWPYLGTSVPRRTMSTFQMWGMLHRTVQPIVCSQRISQSFGPCAAISSGRVSAPRPSVPQSSCPNSIENLSRNEGKENVFACLSTSHSVIHPGRNITTIS